MIRAIAAAVLAFALSALAAERRVLFAVSDDVDSRLVEPIVLLDPIATPPDDDAFTQRMFAPSKQYIASFNGRSTGVLRMIGPVQPGCLSNAGTATFTGDKSAQFATNFEPKPAGTTPRVATAGELKMLRRWARQFLIARGIAAADVEKLEADVVHFDPGDGVPLFAGSLRSLGSTQRRGGVVFFIAAARDVTPTRMSVQYARFYEHNANGNDAAQPLLGTIDLDGDGFAELVTQRIEHEGYSYVLYRRTHGRWIATEGGGAGC